MAAQEQDKLGSRLEAYTIGHSTHPLAEFLEMLAARSIQRLVDVRTVPRSRHNPQYNREELAAEIGSVRLAYVHMPGLGGFRHPRKDSTANLAWRNLSFRGYADYMQTSEFAEQMEQLIAMARAQRIAIMCAEAVPWRCHRSLIADALLVRGIDVWEIVSATEAKKQTLHPWARVRGTQVTYPALPFPPNDGSK